MLPVIKSDKCLLPDQNICLDFRRLCAARGHLFEDDYSGTEAVPALFSVQPLTADVVLKVQQDVTNWTDLYIAYDVVSGIWKLTHVIPLHKGGD